MGGLRNVWQVVATAVVTGGLLLGLLLLRALGLGTLGGPFGLGFQDPLLQEQSFLVLLLVLVAAMSLEVPVVLALMTPILIKPPPEAIKHIFSSAGGEKIPHPLKAVSNHTNTCNGDCTNRSRRRRTSSPGRCYVPLLLILLPGRPGNLKGGFRG